MKFKPDFVTNSSSANFIIPKNILSREQIIALYHHIELGEAIAKRVKKYDHLFNRGDQWLIYEDKKYLYGETSMTNFSMKWFFREIGIDENQVEYHSSND
jgi:hypothetical protein